ncbi:hypothetical protein PAGA_a2081 [Pseudoalteromonas agarivorans DSM 14585]|uniref:Uncharacterized protein n=1 Tax=Pseudoalteromonas agarivorans DSM 14585 TaxID=1312369 RepID=A0ACA8DVX4_9GAMM|nr:hypothetical protein PAGA_a2081 [Pseudoalteromonas agarivorans DSM 14585]
MLFCKHCTKCFINATLNTKGVVNIAALVRGALIWCEHFSLGA